MHIPDGYLDWWICIIMYAVSATVIAYSIKKARKEIDSRRIPMIGIVAAGIFAAQMLNWPIPGGTSAHFVGGALAAIILGPYTGVLAMTSVITLQCLIFGDGGLSALGANIFNMAIVDVFVGYAVYKALRKSNTASFLAGWLGIWMAAIACGLEIGISSIFAYKIYVTVPTMAIWHGLLGIIEGIATASVISYIKSYHPESIYVEVTA
ncbi:MAG: metal transporter [Thermoplasmata archaeon]|nr:MAG: metal transporter [Thermoplasmata archaeon]